MTEHAQRRQRRVPGGSQKRINCRTTEHTYQRLEKRAEAAGLSLPRYLIESGLRDEAGQWSLRQQRWWAERLDVVETRLIRIGVNLNQIATVANSTGELDPGLAGALSYLRAAVQRYEEILDAIDPSDPEHRPRA
ncbi:MobC family plasmid mobilization relaxosome protein [Amycolatopsis japonica]|uniref:MobC family plasmid mobilization relaxosome protein n=1 Tax=Amycolatopsis roodepoortensis TaxID=700274 RepID=A0ABR9KZT2_9PSEU|nr:MobC family plasmid mobilization relaxosome protein [Amycolatopsis roodepoortensis]MBE1573874.1 hypothetical protein [Amycolatopsis roodepoortensis]